jgi:hypothetical protein
MKYIITEIQKDLLLNQTLNRFISESTKISNKLRETIFKRLSKELSRVEVIRRGNEIWFIDRDNKYWYFIYNIKQEKLLWKLQFINNFNLIFDLRYSEAMRTISDWVEGVLGYKVSGHDFRTEHYIDVIEDILADNPSHN